MPRDQLPASIRRLSAGSMCTVTAHPELAACEEIFHRLAERPKSCEIESLRGELEKHKMSPRKRRTAECALRVADHLHLQYSVSAVHSMAALKVFRRCNARRELTGALLRDEEAEKRCTVSGSRVWLIEPEQMATSLTSRSIAIEPLRPSEPSRQ